MSDSAVTEEIFCCESNRSGSAVTLFFFCVLSRYRDVT
jgi:hypothetical protein